MLAVAPVGPPPPAPGADDVPDILFTNYKQIDLVSHAESMNSPQMESVVRASDEALGDLVRILNREVGRGQWVLALTADHGAIRWKTVCSHPISPARACSLAPE